MSDQNQWPKPGETAPEGGAEAGRSAPQQGAPSSAAQPESGQPQQYGASAPEAPAAAQGDPWAQSGQGAASQGVSEGNAAPQDPYAAPQNPYAAPQNPYAAPSNPYAAPGRSSGQTGYAAPQNPYAAQQNPYANQNGNPYAPPAQQNPYTVSGYQPYAQRPRTNTLAVLSIVFGLGAIPFFFMAILLGPAGAILGHIALGKIKQSGESGRGLALTGVIAGWVMTGVWILWIVALVVFASLGSSYSDNYDYGYDSGAVIG